MIRASIIVALALALPTAALADPGSLVYAIALALGEEAIVAAAWAAIAAIATAAYKSERARSKQRRAVREAKDRYNASLENRSVTVLSALPPWQIVYGTPGPVGGAVVAILTSDKANAIDPETNGTWTRPDALKHVVVEFAHHQSRAIIEVYLDGIPVGPLDGSGYVQSGSAFYTSKDILRSVAIAGSSNVVVNDPVASIVTTSFSSGSSVNDVVPAAATFVGSTITNNDTQAVIVDYIATIPLKAVRIQKHLGDPAQTVDAYLNGVLPSEWDSNCRLRGATYIVLTLDLEDERFQGGLPNPTALISGLSLYDRRTGTTAYSENGALAIEDFLKAEWGLGIDDADIDATQSIAAANACDVRESAATQAYSDTFTADASADTITFAIDRVYRTGDGVRFTTTGTLPAPLATATTYYIVADELSDRAFKLATSLANAKAGTTINITSTGSGTHTGTWHDYDRYAVGGVYRTDEDRESFLNDLAASIGGSVVNAGSWYTLPGAWTASVMDLTDDDLAGTIEMPSTDTPWEELFNSVRGVYVPRRRAVPIEFGPYSNATFVTADGEALWEDVAFPMVDSPVRVRNLCRIAVEQSRSGQTLRYPAKLKAWPLRIGDRVRVTSTELGVTLKTYRVTDWGFAVGGAVMLLLREDDSTIYDLADAADIDPTPNTGLANPNVIAKLTGLATTSRAVMRATGSIEAVVDIRWTRSTDPHVTSGGWVEVSYRGAGASPWQSFRVPGDSNSASFPSPAVPGSVVIVGVRAVSSTGRVGSWTYILEAVDLDTSYSGFAPGGNLIDSSTWIVGRSGTQGRANGSLFTETTFGSSSNAVVLDTAPDGVKRAIWEATGDSGGTGTDGGFFSGRIPVDHKKLYRLSVWWRATVQANSAGGIYLGPAQDGDVHIQTVAGVDETNPYNIPGTARNAFVVGRWYLLVGFVLPSSYGTTVLNMSGAWDAVTGQKVLTGVDYKWKTNARWTLLRTFGYNGTSTSNKGQFWGPRYEMCDGAEPSIDALLSIAKGSAAAPVGLDALFESGINGDFTRWTLGVTLPDAWSDTFASTSSSNTIKETATYRSGPNALRFVASGSNLGCQTQALAPFGVPAPAGSFVEGFVDGYVVTNTSGGYPGIVVRLYTNSGLTTYVDTVVTFDKTVTGAWQRRPFRASAGATDIVYGVTIFLLPSWSGMPSGNWTGTVIYDALRAALVSTIGTLQLGRNAAADPQYTTVDSDVYNVPTNSSGVSVQHILGETDIGPFVEAVPIEVTFTAYRKVESTAGLGRGTAGTTAVFHFVRLYKDGVFWFNFPDASDGIDDVLSVIGAGFKVQLQHALSRRVVLPAGVVLTAESVWSILQPAVGFDLTCTTKALSMGLTAVIR